MKQLHLALAVAGAMGASGSPNCAAQTTTAAPRADLRIASGRFAGTADSLKNYQTPDWFRDAKFGIWSHWGPQSVPRQGDWYARRMYIPGDKDYADHLKKYGHPSVHGYKEIIPLWHAEKFDPDALMDLYVKAGAKYFVSMGVHHDNFDLWNSKHHAWNAVNMGPHRDIVGAWKAAATKRGLRFGVSEHLGASYAWFQASHGSDKTGPLAGVPYDGADPKWQNLYQSASNLPFVGLGPSWYTTDPASQADWYRRIQDLLDSYQPDLLYSDGGIPFGEVGRSLIAHLYNSNAARHGGKLEAVYNYKNIGSGEFIEGAGVLDVERGGLQSISAQPWQTDTSIGDWFYSDGYKYKTADAVIHQLADIVSKNGNLLINVVQYPDGSLPPESQTFLSEMAAWMPVNGEAIYGTRPWTIYGEGPTRGRAGNFNENTNYTARDIRFTTKAGAIYALTLGVPTESVVIQSLALNSPLVTGEAASVSLLGFRGELKWQRTANGLEIELPANLAAKHSLAFKITGLRTVPGAQLPVAAAPDQTVEADAATGTLVLLPGKAQLHGQTIASQGTGANTNIGFWDNASEWVSWDKVKVAQSGTYRVSLEAATINAASDFSVEIAGRKLPGHATATGDWNTFQTLDLGEVEIPQTGTIAVTVRPSPATWQAINLRAMRLVKVAK